MIVVIVDLRVNNVVRILPILRELRKEAMHQPGYISGTTLVGAEDRSLISIETIWESIKDWREWEKSQTQIKLFRKIVPFLLEKSKIKIYRYLSYEDKPHVTNSKED